MRGCDDCGAVDGFGRVGNVIDDVVLVLGRGGVMVADVDSVCSGALIS